VTLVKTEEVEVSNQPDATAGKMLLFPAVKDKETLPLPPRLAEMAREGTVDLVTLHGNSLEGIGVFDGDQALCKKAYSKKEIGPHTICIVRVIATSDVFAKKVIFMENMIILRSFNPDIADMFVSPDEVDIQGIVLKILRAPDRLGRFDRGYDDGIPL
jgi:SOS-response transcriptional repressor LexA